MILKTACTVAICRSGIFGVSVRSFSEVLVEIPKELEQSYSTSAIVRFMKENGVRYNVAISLTHIKGSVIVGDPMKILTLVLRI